jgi:hypothetical protein
MIFSNITQKILKTNLGKVFIYISKHISFIYVMRRSERENKYCADILLRIFLLEREY